MRAASCFVLNGDVSATLSKLAAACLLAAAVALGSGCGSSDEGDKTEPSASASAKAGGWKTWVLGSGAEVRVPAPPKAGSAAAERDERELKAAVGSRTEKQVAAARSYTSAPAVEPWIEQNIQLVASLPKDVPASSRAYSNTTVAMYDAFVCCWDAKYAFWMARPITADPDLDVLIPTPPFPSYTSGHATISAAAATVLGNVFPSHASELSEKADEAKNSRLWAGIHFPIDNEVGAAGGARIGRLVIDSRYQKNRAAR